MREILFRGKRTDNGQWIEGLLARYNPAFETANIVDTREILVPVHTKTVCQYTGLTDKNGKRIFEGDVIESDNGRRRGVFVVRYGEFRPSLFYELLDMMYGSPPKEKCFGVFGESIKNGEEVILVKNRLMTVLGNIHDTPDLLEKEQ